MLGDTMSRLNRLDDAVAYYDSARRLESSPAVRKVLLSKIAGAKATLRIQRQNAARQPLLHEALEQDRVVRPQLLARSSPASKAAAPQAGVKPGGVTP
jgi:cytochrome c-type biogenesis protein CcmH/NrfG